MICILDNDDNHANIDISYLEFLMKDNSAFTIKEKGGGVAVGIQINLCLEKI